MTDLSFAPRSLPLLERAAAFAERRHDVLAGNIANISTPGYRTRDLPVADFKAALREAVEQRARKAESAPSLFPGGEQPASLDELFPAQMFRAQDRDEGDLTYQDASNRSIEKEVMEMSKNSLLQNYAVELLIAQFHLLETVINERA